jgi:tight adherence protein B
VTGALAAGVLTAFAVACIATAVAMAERRRVLARVGEEPSLDAAHRRVVAPSWALVAAVAVPAWLAGRAIGGMAVGLAAVGVVVAAPALVRRRRLAGRAAKVQEQLAEGVGVIASGLRSGRSLAGSIELAGDELPAPLGPSFRRVADRVALGDTLEDALRTWSLEVGGPDARVAAGVFGLHRRTGGALSGALDGLASTLRARRSAARELRSLTAQARLSAAILGLLPIGFFLFLSVVARSDVEASFGTPVGSGAVMLGFTLQGLAYLWIRHLLRVEP